jgi:hypothetical protein
MLEAQRNHIAEEEHMFQAELMGMFKSREDFENMMHLYDEFEFEKEQYLDYIEQLEEESNNFIRITME